MAMTVPVVSNVVIHPQAINAAETVALAELRQGFLGIQTSHSEVFYSIACLVDNATGTVHTGTTQKSGGHFAHKPEWVDVLVLVESARNNDSEVKALAHVEETIILPQNPKLINGAGAILPAKIAHTYSLYMLSTHGACKSCKQVIKSFYNFYRNGGPPTAVITSATIFYINKNSTCTSTKKVMNNTMYGYPDVFFDTREGIYYKRL